MRKCIESVILQQGDESGGFLLVRRYEGLKFLYILPIMFVKTGSKLLFKVIIEFLHTVRAFPSCFMSIGIVTLLEPVGSTDSFDKFGIFFVRAADNFLVQQIEAIYLAFRD